MPLWHTLLAGSPAISSFLRRMDPAVGGSMPAMQLKIVLLPEPFGPISPRISPSSTRNDTFDTAVKPLNFLVKPETVRRGIGVFMGSDPWPPASRFGSDAEARGLTPISPGV